MTYATARRDFETLENIKELDDQIELDSDRLVLMQNPTKKTAQGMYEAAIRLWFHEHGIPCETTKKIARRHQVI